MVSYSLDTEKSNLDCLCISLCMLTYDESLICFM